LKTSFLYTIRDKTKENQSFVEENKADLCAALQHTIIEILMEKLRLAAKDFGIKDVAVAGGVSANSALREAFLQHAEKFGWNVFIPKFAYTTDNAAMIAITGLFKYQDKIFCDITETPFARIEI
jgi:N6-L-threonylcarbamoyladenine synthase